MDLIPKPDQVVSAVANVAHILFFGGLADLRPMPRTLIDDGTLREVYHYKPARGVPATGDPVLLVTPLAAPVDLLRPAPGLLPGRAPGARRAADVPRRVRRDLVQGPVSRHGALDRRRAARRDPRGLRARRRPSRAPGRLVARWAVRPAHRRGPVGPADRLRHGAGVARRRQARAAGRSAAAAAQPDPGPRAGDARLPGLRRRAEAAGRLGLPARLGAEAGHQAAGHRAEPRRHRVPRPARGRGPLLRRDDGLPRPHLRAALPPVREGERPRRRLDRPRGADHLAGGRRGPGARLRRRDGRDRPAAVGAGGDAAPDGLARRPLRGRARRSPRDAHRPRGTDVDLAGARRVGGRVVRRDPGAAQAHREEGAGQEGSPEGARGARRPRRSAPTRSAATARPAPAPCRAELAGTGTARLPGCPRPTP